MIVKKQSSKTELILKKSSVYLKNFMAAGNLFHLDSENPVLIRIIMEEFAGLIDYLSVLDENYVSFVISLCAKPLMLTPPKRR